MRISTPLFCLTICEQVVEAVDAQVAAIVPTNSGQIGVNPPDATAMYVNFEMPYLSLSEDVTASMPVWRL
jgi:hypothetical protein